MAIHPEILKIKYNKPTHSVLGVFNEGEDTIYVFYTNIENQLIQLEFDTLEETVEFFKSQLGDYHITRQRIMNANRLQKLYNNDYISNIITHYTDKENHLGYRFVVAYKSIWNTYTKTKKNNRIQKLY